MSLPDRLRDDLKTAMRARDTPRVTVLRSALAAIANAEAPPAVAAPAWPPVEHGASEVARLELDHDDHVRILGELIAEREAAAVAMGDRFEADVLRDEIEILGAYL